MRYPAFFDIAPPRQIGNTFPVFSNRIVGSKALICKRPEIHFRFTSSAPPAEKTSNCRDLGGFSYITPFFLTKPRRFSTAIPAVVGNRQRSKQLPGTECSPSGLTLSGARTLACRVGTRADVWPRCASPPSIDPGVDPARRTACATSASSTQATETCRYFQHSGRIKQQSLQVAQPIRIAVRIPENLNSDR